MMDKAQQGSVGISRRSRGPRRWRIPISKWKNPNADIAARLRVCAEESESGRNFADTPDACREAADLLLAAGESK